MIFRAFSKLTKFPPLIHIYAAIAHCSGVELVLLSEAAQKLKGGCNDVVCLRPLLRRQVLRLDDPHGGGQQALDLGQHSRGVGLAGCDQDVADLGPYGGGNVLKVNLTGKFWPEISYIKTKV